jgi:N-sulfoglucosamine sulfohydrolase
MSSEERSIQDGADSGRLTRREMLRLCAVAPMAAMANSTARGKGDEMSVNRPNILIVHCHDIGQYLHCYGRETVQSPRIDGLAQEGVRFPRSYCTAPQCSPSRSSLFCGRYPHNTGVMGLCHADFAWDLHPEERHLGQILKDAGYNTRAVGIIHETRSGAQRCGYETHSPRPWAVEATNEAIAELGRLAENQDQPFYMSVGFIEPHRLPSKKHPTADMGFLGDDLEPDTTLGVEIPPYVRDDDGARTEVAELQGAVHHVDTQAGRLFDAVKDLGLEENTLVIFTADHGVALPRAKCSLYDPGLQVPFILRLPSREGWHGGITHDSMISNVDYLPTLLDLVGISVPQNVQGRSFAPLLDGGDYTPRDAVFGEITYHDYYDPRRCIRTDTHKLIVNFSAAPAFMDPTQSWRPRSITVEPANPALVYHPLVELYDLREDPWEQKNLSEDPAHAPVRDELLRRLHAHLSDTQDPLLEGAVTSPMHMRAVEALSLEHA